MIATEAQRTTHAITRLTRWPGERRVAKLLFAIGFVGVLALALAPWRQNAVGTGEVIAFSPNERQLHVQAPIEGNVVQWHFHEGDHVEAGEVIVELADNDPNVLERYERQRNAARRRLDAAQRSVEALEARLESLGSVRERTLASASARIRTAEGQREVERLDLNAAAARELTAQLQMRRVTALADDGLESQRSLEVARRNAAQASARRDAARAALEAAEAEVAAKRAEREAKASELAARIAQARDALEAARSSRAQAEGALADAERALARQDSLEVRAPRSGMLTRVVAREGSAYVGQGDELATVVPSAQHRAVALYVSGNDAPLIVRGQPVRLQFEGWPAIQFGGWPEAAVGTFTGEVAFVDAQASAQGRFRVVVRPAGGDGDWPSADVLRQGNEVNGWVLLNEVTLGYEVWRQLNGFPADLPSRAARSSGLAR
ncbi:MAG TPA: HlyD family efflux transporter periplasmic adaptor subunit [Sandaracinaceae bacterium LLY-WYZ-13_1]|nr:HlyD family efflux transporter periplasmic adaptor subunit [Sandaracinaceae bacterium LLY-WYZ-13_1]